MLYEKHNYLDKDISYIISREIIEYDISSAGYNICRKYKLLDDKKLDGLESLPKKDRQRRLGIYQRDIPGFADSLNEKFIEIRKLFFNANNLSDDDILAIKKDAIFTLKRCTSTIFDNIEFVEKNEYSSYYYMNHMEFYVGNQLDVKGISNDKLELHKDGMIDILYKLMKMREIRQLKFCKKSLVDFMDAYKQKVLDFIYYRELNEDSMYRSIYTMNRDPVCYPDITELDDIDIRYNYIRYLVPMVSYMI